MAHVITFALGFMFKLILIIANHNLHAQLVVFIGTHDNFMHVKRFTLGRMALSLSTYIVLMDL